MLGYIAEFTGDGDLHPPLVLVGVVEPALFVVVLGFDLAWVYFKPVENQVLVQFFLVVLGVVRAEHHLGCLHLVGWGVHRQVVTREGQGFLHLILLL